MNYFTTTTLQQGRSCTGLGGAFVMGISRLGMERVRPPFWISQCQWFVPCAVKRQRHWHLPWQKIPLCIILPISIESFMQRLNAQRSLTSIPALPTICLLLKPMIDHPSLFMEYVTCKLTRACFFVRQSLVFESEDNGGEWTRKIHVNLEQQLTYFTS